MGLDIILRRVQNWINRYKSPIIRIIESGLSIVVGGVLLRQTKLPLAALEYGVMGDLSPLVVAGPGDDLAVDRVGQVICGP